jgi:beta-galactosidase
VVTVQVADAQQRLVPDASNEIAFAISGPGKIIGVGNGDPSSHEPDSFVESVGSVKLTDWRMKMIDSLTNRPEVEFAFDDSAWQRAFSGGAGGERRRSRTAPSSQPTVYRGSFELPEGSRDVTLTLMWHRLSTESDFFLNGQQLKLAHSPQGVDLELPLDASMLRPGRNVVAVIAGVPAKPGSQNEGRPEANPGIIRLTKQAPPWKRCLFNGLAQIIVQSSGAPGEITLTAKAQGLTQGELRLKAKMDSPHTPGAMK